MLHRPSGKYPKLRIHYLGLTLIEMMLVVVVFAIATLAGIKIIKNQAANSAVTSVAAQMQNVAAGVVAYYMTNQNTWPKGSLEALATSSPAYFPAAALCAPFKSSSSSSLCGYASEIQGNKPSSYYYNITLTTDSNNAAAAIASRLPNASTNGTNTITMAITAPAQYFVNNGGFNDPNQGWIVAAGLISFTPYIGSSGGGGNSHQYGYWGTPVVLPNCPPGFEGHVLFAPQRYQTAQNALNGNNDWGIHTALTDPQARNNSGDSIYNVDRHGNQIYYTQIIDKPDTQGNPSNNPNGNNAVEHLAYFMTFCIANGHWGVSTFQPKGQVNSMLQVWQCSDTWQIFLKGPNPSPANCGATVINNNSIVGSSDAFSAL